MRLSIWQQFSSNHSASFMLVGQFKSAERAQEVADELRAMLREIGSWWEQFPSDAQQHLHIANELIRQGKLTPPEEKYRTQYHVPWSLEEDLPIDWIHSQAAVNAVRTWNNLVIVEPDNDTWAGPTPLDEILMKLGGNVAAQCEIYDETYLAVNLSCVAPSEATAEAMIGETSYSEWVPGNKLLAVSNFNPTQGKVLRDGLRITYQHYDLGWMPADSIEQQLQQLIDYVRGHGCTDIHYTFVEAPYPKD